MSFSPLIRQLIDSLRILPGVGQKTAQRMALQLLERDRSGGQRLAQALNAAMEGVGHCKRCRSLSEDDICQPVSYTHLDVYKRQPFDSGFATPMRKTLRTALIWMLMLALPAQAMAALGMQVV